MTNTALKEVSEKQEEEELSLEAKLGSLLFVSTKPLNIETLAKASGGSLEDVESALENLSKKFEDQSVGFALQHVGGSWQFRSASAARKTINKLIPPKARRLSRAAAETLAVVAYRQPVQRAEIEAIRGVDALQTLKTLLDAKLVRIVGRDNSPGQPALYGTTEYFLQKFGLGDLSELPTIKELEELAEEPEESNRDFGQEQHSSQ
jgi:segregation and condensation protein B